MASRALKRSVLVSLTRQQMFSHGYRPITWQRVALGAAPDGRLDALVHEAVAGTSRFEDYTERVVDWSGMLYKCDNVTLDYKLAKLDLNTPADMRAPGAAWGLYALECAMDELAVKLRMDPVDLRLRNYAETDGNSGLPYSSKALRECYRVWGRAIRLGEKEPRAAVDEAGGHPHRVGHGNSHVGSRASAGVREGRALRRRHPQGVECDGGHRHRHLHDHDADCRGHARAADRAGGIRAWRFVDAESVSRRRVAHRVVGRLGGESGMRQGRRTAARTCTEGRQLTACPRHV